MGKGKQRLFVFGPFCLNPEERLLTQNGVPVPMTPKAIDTLSVLVRNNGHVVSRNDLMKEVWEDTNVEEANLTVVISKLRKALGQGGSTQGYIETVPKLGYRFTADLAVKHLNTAASCSAKKTFPDHRSIVERERLLPTGERIKTVAVLPLTCPDKDSDIQYIADGITENIISSLSRIRNLRVISRNTAFRFKGGTKPAYQIGRDLRAQAVVTGVVRLVEGRLTISAELIDTQEDSQLWGGQLTQGPTAVIRMQEEVARKISEELRTELTREERERISRRYTENMEAYYAYIKGRYCWNKRSEEGLKQAVDYFRGAIEFDPAYALAYAGLSDSLILLLSKSALAPHDAVARAKSAAEQTIAIDPQLAEPHASLGYIAMAYEWDMAKAGREFELALGLNPSYATAHHWRSLLLRGQGDFAGALAEIKKARKLDPLSPIIDTALCLVFYFMREFDQAIERCDEVIKMHQPFASVHVCKGLALLGKTEARQALAAFKRASNLIKGAPEPLAFICYTYAALGEQADARRMLSEIEAHSRSRYVSPHILAIAHLGLGTNDQAFNWLDKAVDERDEDMQLLGFYPLFDSLRSEPRFQKLLSRIASMTINNAAAAFVNVETTRSTSNRIPEPLRRKHPILSHGHGRA